MQGNQRNCCVPHRTADVDVEKPIPVDRRNGSAAGHLRLLGGDWFNMGSDNAVHPEDGEGPCRPVWLDEFSIAATAVSNLEFQRFVDDTGYITDAERVGSSFVFHAMLVEPQVSSASSVAPWWRDVAGACWHSPEGPGSDVADRATHPVVHVSRDDALAYCQWAGCCLPSEAQWEYAARGGLAQALFPWGDELLPAGQHRCNIWQGEFPRSNTCEDGFFGTAPVDEFKPNAYGLYNMTGNVWEWVADRFTRLHSPRKVRNPRGPLNGESFVSKGGSWLCHESYCLRYRNASRQALPAGTSAANLGFRVARDVIPG